MKNRSLFIIAAIALFSALWVTTASAQVGPRFYVASTGNNANACSRSAPCRTFDGALGAASPGAEIDVIDSAEFFGFTVSQSVSIVAIGVVAGSSDNVDPSPIKINAANRKVSIRGLTIVGNNVNTNGITVTNASDVDISDCHITGFAGGAGIIISSNTLTRVHIYNSEIIQNKYGVEVAAGSTVNGVLIENSSIDYNLGGNIFMNGSNGAVLVGNSSLQGGPALLIASGTTATVQSYGDNRVSGSFPATIVQRQ